MTDLGHSVVPAKLTPPREWGGSDYEGGTWALEVDTDSFTPGQPLVVAVWATNDEGTGSAKQDAVAMLEPEQAREVAAALLRLADHVEKERARVR